MPCGRRLLHDLVDRRLLNERPQASDPGHERLAFRERFRATGAREMKRAAVFLQVLEKTVHESGLSKPGVGADTHESATALECLVIGMAEPVVFVLTADDVLRRTARRSPHAAGRG